MTLDIYSVIIDSMNAERVPALRQRAAIHAALADPARLAIVDALALGDVSPSELQTLVDLPSNLLAHHLKVLESHGVVTRSRSEADRRRTYVRLLPGSLDALHPGARGDVARVVFVCTRNSARSHLAAALWRRSSSVPTASAGTHPAERIDPGALAVAARHQVSMRRVRPRKVEDVLHADDLIITVCDAAHEELGAAGAVHWSVPDPVPVGSAEAFEAVFTQLSQRVGDLASRFTAN